jgi:hypothetical protein
MLHKILEVWISFLGQRARDEAEALKLAEIQGKLDKFNEAQSANAKSVVTRMAAGNDEALTDMCFQAWVKFIEEYNKDRAFNDEVKKAEQMMAEHMKKNKEVAKGVMAKIQGANNTGLLSMCVVEWGKYIAEEKHNRQMENELSEKTAQFSMMNSRQAGNASKMQSRVNEQMNQNLLVRIILAWTLETKQNRVDKYYSQRLDRRRQQLTSVEHMFKHFAAQLDSGLGGDGVDSSRNNTRQNTGRRQKSGRHMAKHTEGTSSLPDIHARPIAA